MNSWTLPFLDPQPYCRNIQNRKIIINKDFAGATINVEKLKIAARTDANGNFSIHFFVQFSS
jgi:hypothetical protein